MAVTDHHEAGRGASGGSGPGMATCGRHLLRRPRRRAPLRRAAIRVVAFAVSGLFLATAAAAFLFAGLRQGPIGVDFKPQIVAALNSRVGHGYRFDLAGTAVEVTDHGPALTIRDLSVSDAASRPIVSAPSAAVSLDLMALLVGRVAPTRLEIHDVDLRLVIRPDGQVAVSAGSDDAATPLARAFSSLPSPPSAGDASPAELGVSDQTATTPPRPANAAIRALSATMRALVDASTAPDSALNALQRVIVTGRLVLDDRTHGTKTVFKNTVLSFDRGSDGAAILSVAADGPAGRWSLAAHAAAQPDGAKLLTVDATDLSLDEITLAGGLRSLGFDFDVPVSASVTVRLAPDGEIDTAKGTFSLGAGYFRLDDPDHEPLLIDSAVGGFHLDRATNGIDIDRTELRAGPSDFVITGHADLPQGADDPWSVKVDASGTFGAERPGEKPIRIGHAGFGFRLFPAARRLLVDRAELTGPEVDFAATAEVRNDAGGLHIKNVASVKHMQVQVLARLWPSFISAPVRAWLLANLRGGTVESGTATADLDEADLALMKAEHSVADGHVRVNFAVSNLSLAFMAGVPPLNDVDGTGVVTGHTFDLAVRHGSLDVSPGHRLTLADGNLHVADSDPRPTPATIDAHIVGGVDTVLELLARDALKPYADLPTDGLTLRGGLDGHLSVALKFGPDVPPNSAVVAATATATNLAVDRLIGKDGLTDGTVKLDLDRSGFRAKGDVRIYGAPATLEIHKPSSGPGEALVATTLDDAARARAGLTFAAGLKGAVGARITAALGTGEKPRAMVDLDLTKALLDGLVPGYTKPLGRPARATFTATARDGATVLDNIAYESGGAVVRGSAEFAKDGDFTSAKLSQVKISPGDDLRIDLQQSGDVLKIVGRGANLDARPFLKWLSGPSPSGGPSEPPSKGALDLDLRSTILTGQNGQAVTGAELRVVRRGGQIRRLTLAGRLGRQPLTIATEQIDNAPHFLIHAGDAGAALLFTDLYKRMSGGRLDANVVTVGQKIDGYATVHDFTLREDPAIRKLAVEGLASRKHDETAAAEAQALDTSAMTFRKLEAYFTKSGNIVEVRDGSIFGPGLGATVAGTIDFSRDQVSLGGTFVPLFGVNNLFSQVPLFGPLLGGGRHEGLVGLSYHIAGSATNPVLNVNPLSVLAPGFLRQVIGALDGSASAGSHPDATSVGPTTEQE